MYLWKINSNFSEYFGSDLTPEPSKQKVSLKYNKIDSSFIDDLNQVMENLS